MEDILGFTVYLNNSVSIQIDADNMEIDYERGRVLFKKNDEPVAYYNWNNIQGFKIN